MTTFWKDYSLVAKRVYLMATYLVSQKAVYSIEMLVALMAVVKASLTVEMMVLY